MSDKEKGDSSSKHFITSLVHYANKEKCRFTWKLREKTNGYENNDDNTVKRTKNQRDDYIKKYKDTLHEDDMTEMKLRRMDIIYRLYYTEDAKLRKLMNEYKNLVKKIGIDIQKLDDHSDYQHNLRCVGYYQGIYKIYKEAQLRPDECNIAFIQLMKKDYEPKYKLEVQEEPYQQLLSLFYTIEDMQKQIMQFSIYDEKDDSRQKLIKEYKIVDEEKKEIDYTDSYTDNTLENILEFRYGYDLFDEFRSDEIVSVRQKEKLNYVKEFYERYEDVLKNKSPDFWQFLLFDVLKVLCNKSNTDEQLQEMLINLLDDFDACRFLLQNRKEIILYLYKNHFAKDKQFSSSISTMKTEENQGLTNYEILKSIGMKDIDIEKESRLGLKKKDLDSKVSQAQSKNQYDVDDEFSEIDFIKQEQSQLVQKIPSLEKNDYPEYIQLKISPMPRHHSHVTDLVKIEGNFPDWARDAFGSIQSLNVVQSKVYKTAFQTDDNILICAPTGAGKTNIAMMTVLREIEKHINPQTRQLIDPTFKIIYISPMKALASEIVDKFSGMLKHLNIKCKELTGDMQLTKKEIEETQIIVTTPEKWDVFTRKKNEVAETLRLLIIDEIHLLNDERGPVLECLVSRTLQNIERQQKSVRMLGLSATLPNYLDVASFLHVKKESVFFFDATYRPVPLMQRYIGVREPKQSGFKVKRKKIDVYNDLSYQISKGILEHKKQVLIFVHSRKETIVTAQYILKRAQDSQELHLFKSVNVDKHSLPKIKDKELQKLAPWGLGFHHAGMLRKDRNIVEKMFNDGQIRILVATATLAWGVNLPAYGVIIKGTDVYDPSRGGTQDLSVLDIQQMFGRAGRPQFDNNGEATLMTDINKLNSFVAQLNNASFIESRFTAHLKEALNAEIALGNIATLKEAFDWVNYTFYAIRLRRNPMGYGCKITQNKELSIEMHITETIENALEHLDKLRLIRWDRHNNYLASTELGRITSHYYINCDTMSTFCKGFGISLDNNEDFEENEQKRIEYKSDLGILKIIAQAKEFENIKMRPEETEELAIIIKKYWIFDEQLDINVKRICSTDNNTADNTMLIDTPEKILALISGYLCKYQYENFSLISDSMFVIQNSIRLLRCMLDIVTKKSMAYNTELVSRWCKFIEQRLIPDDSALHQFCKSNWQGYNSFKQRKENREGFLSEDVVNKIDEREVSLDTIREMPATELAHAISWNTKVASVIKKFVCFIPRVEVDYTVRPIAQTVLKVDVFITPKWSWSNRWHSKSELFTLTVDDENEIMHHESFTISQQQVFSSTPTEISFFVPFRDSKVPYYRLLVQHDTWVNQPETEVQINLENIYFQGEKMEYTELLDLHPLPTTVLNNPDFEKIYKMKYFNPNQTQIFHAMYNTDHNILIGSPTGSGKTIMSELSALRVFNLYPQKKVIYVAPLKAIAKERLADWEVRFGQGLGKTVLELTGDYTPDLEALLKADVLITTPEKWDGISRNWNNRAYVQKTGLVIFDEIHLLGQDRGPVLEVIVSRMNLISSKTGHKVRMVGLSTAMANGTDVADWFGVPKNYFFNFRPHVRPVPLKIYFDGFSAKAYCPRMAEMNKPAFQQIRKFGEKKPVLVFVSSRRQTRLTALDLIAHAMHDIGGGQSPFVMCQEEELQIYLENIKDEYLKQTVSFGIGMHHAGLDSDDRKIVEELFLAHKIQILVATSTLAWGVNLPARLVIIKGTEFFDPKTKRYVDMPVTDILQMIGRAGRPQFDDKGIACVFVEQSKKNFYRKYLNDPFPIESSLISQIHDHFNAEIACGTIMNKQQCMDWITWTYFFRRMLKNPTYYNLENADTKSVKKFLIELVDECMNRLAEHGCIKIDDEMKFDVTPTFLGQLAAFYYIKHESIFHFDKNITENATIPELLRVLSYSKEFDEIPLRHNEENYNEALAKICPLKCDKTAFNSSNEKTFLLYQVHLFRLPPPIRDYLTDAKIVVDSSIRILSAMIDLAAEKRLLNTCINLCMMMQMIMQGVWFDQSPLINIPHFDQQIVKKLGIVHFCQIIEEYKKQTLRATLKKIDKKFGDDRNWKEVEDAIKSLPDISLRARIYPFDSESLKKTDVNVKQSEIQLTEGGEAVVQIIIDRENDKSTNKVIVQKTGKIKDASWWVLVGDEYTGKLQALKKIFFKNSLKKDLQIILPNSFETSKKLTVFLISDSYLGLDQVFSLNLRSKDLKNDEKYNYNSGSDDDIPKPIRQRLSDDENDKEKKKEKHTHSKYTKGNTLKKNKEREENKDSDEEISEKKGESSQQKQETEQTKESPNKKKNVLSKKKNDSDREDNDAKDFDRNKGNTLTKKKDDNNKQPEKKESNQGTKEDQPPKEKKEYPPKTGDKDNKKKRDNNRERKGKFNNERRQQESDNDDEYDIGYKVKEGGQVDEFTRKRREEKDLDKLQSKNNPQDEDEDIHQKIKDDSDFSDEEDENQRSKYKNKRGGQNFNRGTGGGQNKTGNQLRKRNDDDYNPREREDNKPYQGERKFNNNNSNQNTGEKRDNDRKQYEKKPYEKKEQNYQPKDKKDVVYERKENPPQQQQQRSENPPKEQQQQNKPQQNQQEEQRNKPPATGFKLKRKNSDELQDDDKDKKNFNNNRGGGNNNNNRGGQGSKR